MAFQLKQIIAWDNSVVPSGWAICNGQTVNGITTPDLRNRMVRCTNTPAEIKTTQGNSTHSHTFATTSTGSSSAHNHTASGSFGNSGTSSDLGTSGTGSSNAPNHNHTAGITIDNNTTLHTHTITSTTTTSSLPRHIKLLFIMKVA